MTGKLPSIRTVASLAGVSTATVSNVLNARRSVGPALAARVHAAVAELGYIADLGASRLRSRRSTVVGVLVPDIANAFFGAFVAVLEGAARREGYDLLAVSSGDDPVQEAARLRALLTWRPAGVILIPCDDRLPGREVARAAGVPLIAADRIPLGGPLDLVAVNNRQAAAEVAQHLIAGGRRHILAVAARASISNVAERIAGARAAARAAGATLEVLEVGFTLADSRARLAARLADAAAAGRGVHPQQRRHPGRARRAERGRIGRARGHGAGRLRRRGMDARRLAADHGGAPARRPARPRRLGAADGPDRRRRRAAHRSTG